MKPRHKVFWLNPDKPEATKDFINHLDEGWALALYMPTEQNVMIVLWKNTDPLDGLSMAVNTALSKEKNANKPTQ